MGVYSNLQVAIFAVLQQILQTIIADGVKIAAPQYYTDKEGAMILAQYTDQSGKLQQTYDIEAHPPLGPLASWCGAEALRAGQSSGPRLRERREHSGAGEVGRELRRGLVAPGRGHGRLMRSFRSVSTTKQRAKESSPSSSMTARIRSTIALAPGSRNRTSRSPACVPGLNLRKSEKSRS